MDPGTLAILLHSLIPIIAVLAVFGFPVGIIFVNKNHKLRMRELELEAMHVPASTDQRLKAIEERLSIIESVLTGEPVRPALPSAQERAALVEGPPTRVRTP